MKPISDLSEHVIATFLVSVYNTATIERLFSRGHLLYLVRENTWWISGRHTMQFFERK